MFKSFALTSSCGLVCTALITATLLTGCGANPSALNATHLRTVPQQAAKAPMTMDAQIARALAAQFPGTAIQVSDIEERIDLPGTFGFAAQVQSRTTRTITTVHGEFSLPQRGVRVIDSTTDAL